MNLNSLMIFAKVVGSNSFSEAARRLQMPISTVSRQIAELEDQLGVRLIERSTRSLRLTEVGCEVLEHAKRSLELRDAIDDVVSRNSASISGLLRLSAPPSICDTLLAPLISSFQAAYPEVRIQISVTDRVADPVADDVDLVFRLGPMKDSALIARKILSHRHQLVASPAYLETCKPPETPKDVLDHRLLAFSYGQPENRWTFRHAGGQGQETVTIRPSLSTNDLPSLRNALLAGGGIGNLPVLQTELLQRRQLVEVLPQWRFETLDVSMVHARNRLVPRPLRAFTEFAARMAPTLVPTASNLN
jgi:DNA-binding transcriptional LysR family regulator